MITLFHAPKAASSARVLALLKKASEEVQPKKAFQLEVSEAAPTADQARSILEFIGVGRAKDFVSGATDQNSALSILKREGVNSVTRPLVVDWSNGKAGEQSDQQLR